LDERPRLCIACRNIFPRSSLLKLTATRDGEFSIDNRPPLQGRSAYVCRKASCLAEALKGKKFQRTLKRGIPDDIVEALNVQLKGMSQQ
jgi:predicted RNA-binding protein YlxR (DUF448 family)